MTKFGKLLTLLLAFAFVLSANVMADEVKILTNPHCGMCKNKIEKGLKKVSGVDKAELNLEQKLVTVKYDGNVTSAEVIMKKVEELGYTAELYTANEKASTPTSDSRCCSTSKTGSKKDCSTSDKCCKDGSAKADNCCKDGSAKTDNCCKEKK